MRPLAAVERFFERLFEGQAARLFRTKLQPIQLQRRIERAMESERVRDGDRSRVPNRFAVHLAAADLDALREAHPTLAGDLADAALAFARNHGYQLADRPSVALIADVSVQVGDLRVAAGHDADRRADASASRDQGAADLHPTPAPPSPDRTAVFVTPVIDAPHAKLMEIRPDGSSRTFEVDGRPVTIGRAPDNRLVLRDTKASRHHARLYGRQGTLIFADLGSTNGSWVNDRRVQEMALGVGDRIRVGDTILVVEIRRSALMDGFVVTIWVVRLLFLALLYLFLFGVARALLRDLGAASREPTTELGRLVVVASPAGEPAEGTTLALDAITTLGRDVNNRIVVDDTFASSEHAILTFRGRTWYIEDLNSTNGTFVNGAPVDGVAPLGYGDEIQLGQVRLRLERSRR